MKLWLLRPADSLKINNDPWKPWYDKAFGFVIRAETEKEARKFAHDSAGDENREGLREPWLNEDFSTCIELLKDGQPSVIIQDFAAA